MSPLKKREIKTSWKEGNQPEHSLKNNIQKISVAVVDCIPCASKDARPVEARREVGDENAKEASIESMNNNSNISREQGQRWNVTIVEWNFAKNHQ